jgi:hypothetical protein
MTDSIPSPTPKYQFHIVDGLVMLAGIIAAAYFGYHLWHLPAGQVANYVGFGIGIFGIMLVVLGYFSMRASASTPGGVSLGEAGAIILAIGGAIMMVIAFNTEEIYKQVDSARYYQTQKPVPPVPPLSPRIKEVDLTTVGKIDRLDLERVAGKKKVLVLLEVEPNPDVALPTSVYIPSGTHGKVWYVDTTDQQSLAQEF